MSRVVFKEVSSTEELDRLQHLNHAIFAKELRQHEARPEGFLLDRFHAHNRYFIALNHSDVVGMICINSQPPFSVEKRLPPNVSISEIAPAPCEVRLLAVAAVTRGTLILAGLLWQVFAEAKRRGRSHILISGATARVRMYQELGFRSLGPPITDGDASFVPMVLDLQNPTLVKKAEHFERWWQRRGKPAKMLSLLPGPVQISKQVQQVFAYSPTSHRDPAFIQALTDVRERLRSLAAGLHVAILTGSGTLANDVVAACLRSAFGDASGLVLANGEFGERLVRQAQRAGLNAKSLHWDWGSAWDREQIQAELDQEPHWVWAVHLETSTGQVNDLPWLTTMCNRRNIAVAADCVSSLGAVPFPTGKLYLATGVSGKSLGAYAGLAFVFASDRALAEVRSDQLPATFDIVSTIQHVASPFTVASPQLYALHAALDEHYIDSATIQRRLVHYASLGEHVRSELKRLHLDPIAVTTADSPPISTFVLPDTSCVARCSQAGFHIAHESGYLAHRGWGQIAVMGDLTRQAIQPLFDVLRTT